jgi:hypothetical protein
MYRMHVDRAQIDAVRGFSTRYAKGLCEIARCIAGSGCPSEVIVDLFPAAPTVAVRVIAVAVDASV